MFSEQTVETMTTPTTYAKDLGNLLYHSAIVGGLSVGHSMIGKGS